MSNNNTITPAPWELSDMSCCDGSGKFNVCFHIGKSDTGELIAELHGESEKDYKHVERNAELVRVAPEMLELMAEISDYLSCLADVMNALDATEGGSRIPLEMENYVDKIKHLRKKIGA